MRLSRNPVMPRKPPMLFLRMSQNFSVNVGSGCCGGRDSRLRVRRRRGRRSDEPVCKTCRCRFCTATAEESERLIESIDQIHNIVAGSLGISRNLLREIRALYRDGRDKPRGQSTESKKGDGEK